MRTLCGLVVVAGMLPTFAMAQVETMRTCLEIEDQSKERLNCYDEKIKPEPKQVSTRAKTVKDCRFLRRRMSVCPKRTDFRRTISTSGRGA